VQKREVPKIANLPKYRMMLAPFIKRRVKQEPDVARYVKTPEARVSVVNIDWSDAHLLIYLKVADQLHSGSGMRSARPARTNAT